jgi:hypothetical protein
MEIPATLPSNTTSFVLDRIDNAQTAIRETGDLATHILAEGKASYASGDMLQYLSFAGKSLTLGGAVISSGSVTGLVKTALIVGGAKKVQSFFTPNEDRSFTNSYIKTPINALGNEMYYIGQDTAKAVQKRVQEHPEVYQDTTNLAVAAAVTLPVLYFSFESAKSACIAIQVASMAYDVYANHEEILASESVQFLINDIPKAVQDLNVSTLSSDIATYFQEMSSEAKIALGVTALVAVPTLIAFGPAIAVGSGKLLASIATPAIAAARIAGQAYLGYNVASMLFPRPTPTSLEAHD